MICPLCHNEIKDGSVFCGRCGKKIPRCPTCGALLEEPEQFCPEDGTRIPEDILSVFPADLYKDRQNSPDRRERQFCIKCGRPCLPGEKYCENCASPKTAFCVKCGEPCSASELLCKRCQRKKKTHIKIWIIGILLLLLVSAVGYYYIYFPRPTPSPTDMPAPVSTSVSTPAPTPVQTSVPTPVSTLAPTPVLTFEPAPEPTDSSLFTPTPVPQNSFLETNVLQNLVDSLNTENAAQRTENDASIGIFELGSTGHTINYKVTIPSLRDSIKHAREGNAEHLRIYNQIIESLPELEDNLDADLRTALPEDDPNLKVVIILMYDEFSDDVIAVVDGGRIIYDVVNNVGSKPFDIVPITQK